MNQGTHCKLSLKANLEKFDKDVFQDWLLNKKKQTKWTSATRFKFIMWLKEVCGYEAFYQIVQPDFNKTRNGLGDYSRIWNMNYEDHKKMIIDVVKENTGEELQYDLFIKSDWEIRKEIHDEHEELLKKSPLCPSSSDDVDKVEWTRTIINGVPALVARLLVALTLCGIAMDNSLSRGSIYIVFVKATLQIIYIGSSNFMRGRQQGHISDSLRNSKRRLSGYCNENDLKFGDDLDFLVVAQCDVGFEMFVEAAMYDELMKVNDLNLVNLQNGERPVRNLWTIDSLVTLYLIIDLNREKQEMYTGSTYCIHYRYSTHWTKMYGKSTTSSTEGGDKKRTEKIYKEIMRINPDKWPDNVKMVPIEKCPVHLRAIRENYWIEHYDLIENGFNSIMAEDDTNGTGYKSCRFCAIEIKMGGIVRHENNCNQNPNKIGKKFECSFCNQKFTRNDGKTNHEKNCSQRPEKLAEKLRLLQIENEKKEQKRAKTIPQNPLQKISFNENHWESSNRTDGGGRKLFNHKKFGGIIDSLRAALEYRISFVKTNEVAIPDNIVNGFDREWNINITETPTEEIINKVIERYNNYIQNTQ